MVRISNLQLIKLLEENGRAKYVEIAKKLGVSETAIRKRIRKLVKEGILKFTINVNFKKIGCIEVIIGVDTVPEKYFTVVDKLIKMKEVKELYYSTGDHALLIKSWFENNEKVRELVRKIEKIEGVTRVCPAIILERVK